MAHAYFIAGDIEQGIEAAVVHAEGSLGSSAKNNPNITTLRHGLLSVEDARKLRMLAELAPTVGDRKALIISASRLFHEAQNALLKLFEEPPAGTMLVLVVPSEGMILPTLRSRLQSLSLEHSSQEKYHEADAFIAASTGEREKQISKLLDRTKSDKDEDKQAARLAALRLVEGLTIAAHDAWQSESKVEVKNDLCAFIEDLYAFTPILHDRSAPLKLIFEHVLLTVPPLHKLST